MTQVHSDKASMTGHPETLPARVLAARLAVAGLGAQISRHQGGCELTIMGAASGKSIGLDVGPLFVILGVATI